MRDKVEQRTCGGITKFGEVVIGENGITARDFEFYQWDTPTAQIAALWWALGQVKEALKEAGEHPD